MVALVALGVVLVLLLEPAEHIEDYLGAEEFERLEVDEFSFAAVVVVAGLGCFATRRWREAVESVAEAARITKGQLFARRLYEALDMAQSEAGALTVVEEALTEELPGVPVELLLADSSRAHLSQVATTDRENRGPGCPVPVPSECPAVHRSRTMTFTNGLAFDACPYLRTRPTTARSAVCVPVSMTGEAVGVLHATPPGGKAPDHRLVATLEQVGERSGDRLAALRAFHRSEAQAATDPLTGLLNRRSVDDAVADLHTAGRPYAVLYGDLDHFKRLNDTHGHETGDRALRLAARVLRETARSGDLVSRWGGEEFLVVMPDAAVAVACALGERVREALALAVADGGAPPFTASFGVSDSLEGREFDRVVAAADSALLTAKRQGRNRVVLAGTEVTPLAPVAQIDPEGQG